MSEDLILKVFIGTLLVLIAIPIFIWCLNWFIDETYELIANPKESIIGFLLLILIGVIVYYLVR